MRISDWSSDVCSSDLHADRHVARTEIDGFDPLRLAEREEWIGHQILAVARRHVAGQGAEQVELFALLQRPLPGRQGGAGHGDGLPRAADQRARLSAEWCSAYSGSGELGRAHV